MKHLLTSVALALVGCLAVYLIGSFFFVTFDISRWDEGGRFTGAFLFCMCIYGGVVYYDLNKPKQ